MAQSLSFAVFRHGLHGLHGFFMRDDNRFTYISAINPCNPCLIYTKKLIPHSPPFYRIKQPSLKTAFFSSIDENFLISIIFSSMDENFEVSRLFQSYFLAIHFGKTRVPITRKG